MAHPLSPEKFLLALSGENIKIKEHRKWKTHHRNGVGAERRPWGPVNGVMIHHTVTEGVKLSVDTCYEGRPGLPGPLCHGVIDKEGVVHLVGGGRANHAGLGDAGVLRAVVNEKDLPDVHFSTIDGNARFYGFECINLGDGKDPWPDKQLETMARASAGLCRVHGWSAKSVIGHKEWQKGKVDPKGVSMSKLRDRVAHLLK